MPWQLHEAEASVMKAGSEQFTDPHAAMQREWLETNGLGGFAMSTLCGMNTRRYHGLLVAATEPPVGRMVLLSKIEAVLLIDGHPHALSTNDYQGFIHPSGFQYLREFRLDPFPTMVYDVDGVVLHMALFMVYGEDSTVIEYSCEQPGGDNRSVELMLRPLIAFRDYHAMTHRNDVLNPAMRQTDTGHAITPYSGLPTLHIAHSADRFVPDGDWYYAFQYAHELERGLDALEDLFSPCSLSFQLSGSKTVGIIFSTEPRSIADIPSLRSARISRTVELDTHSSRSDERLTMLVRAADQFIVARGTSRTVIAGYPWFGDWGRDTMIALPGLTLATGRFDIARDIFLAFVPHISQGMLPNRFPDSGAQPEYNTVDATLWFFEAVRQYASVTGDRAFVRANLYASLCDIIDWHLRGTRHGIHVDDTGLLQAGLPGDQLTWMDAKIGDWVVTPRHGAAVEVQALWYNALMVLADLAETYADTKTAAMCKQLARKVKRAFAAAFWNDEAGCLYDCISEGVKDASIRPNQLFAVSLRHGLLSASRARSVVQVVERELFTPIGLRTLAPGHPTYRPLYHGDQWSRDSAYHQGTIWPWLLGPFYEAYLRVHDFKPKAVERVRKQLDESVEQLGHGMLGQIAEIYDAESPHRPRGCPAQAWSVAELLRISWLLSTHQNSPS